jgi:hypothetical protein
MSSVVAGELVDLERCYDRVLCGYDNLILSMVDAGL